MFGVLIFALNESKFIGYALRGYLSSSLVQKIVVVEGCVQFNKHAANDDGLSRDGMAKVIEAVIAEDKTDRIVYERHGWAENKSELQNRCIELMEQHASRVEYYILAGGDEVYDPADLERLKKEIERLHKPDVPLYEFVHPWKRPDLRAVDSMWDTWMHRCYRNHGKGMRFGHHAGPPLKPDGSQLNQSVKVRGVRVYHYSAMKDSRDIKDRIKFYQARDGKGKDTWTDWRPGKPTQWTHGGGTAEAYDGPHPPAIAADVWGLVPDMPRPKKCKVFLSGRKEDREKVKDFIVKLSALCPITVVGLVNPRWPGVEFRKVRNLKKMLDGADLLVVANRHVVLAPKAKHNVILAYDAPAYRFPLDGYRIVSTDERVGVKWNTGAVAVSHPGQLLVQMEDIPVVKDGVAKRTPILEKIKSGKGKAGNVQVLRLRPLVVRWNFVNPTKGTLKSKQTWVGYSICLDSGRKIQGRRTVTNLPANLRPGEGFAVEITLPLELPPSEYRAKLDFYHNGKWGEDMGIAPSQILYKLDRNGQIWVR